jgi:hypothetical protein
MPTPERLQALIVEMLGARTGSMCPSEVARAVEPWNEWRSRMPGVREAARALAERHVVQVTQRGRVLDPHAAWSGALRLSRGARFEGPARD